MLYQNYSERYVSCTHENQMIKLDLTYKHSYNQNRDKEPKQTHLGLVIIELKRLHIENLSAKALIYLYDNRFTNIEQELLGSIELNVNSKGKHSIILP